MEKIYHQTKKYYLNISFILILLFILIPTQTLTAQYKIVNAFKNLSFSSPVDIQNAGDNSDRLFVVSQTGIIHVFENNSETQESSEFLNITNQVLSGGEQGLLGLAFHPDFETNGYFYVDYTTDNPRRTVVSRFTVSSTDLNVADANSELVLLEVNQPYSNHNGGQIAFGPDGYLYISLGDGGSGGDPQNNAQNLSSLLGKILRIDVDNQEDGNEYAIPTDNPFKDNSNNYSEEIYAFGLRNVWRFSFDGSGKLWAADVGQNEWEEVNIIEKGGNYGWRIMEGFHCYNPSSGCDETGLTLPELEYAHNSSGGYSITGGYVYEGNENTSLNDKYIYADYVSGNIWAYDYSSKENSLLFNESMNISTFGIDEQNELYFADLTSGKIYKFEEETGNSIETNNPTGFKLYQNYPNPFNPSTNIEFEIVNPGNVTLEIYDLLGRRAAALLDKYKFAGKHKVTFNTNDLELTSGIYLYKLNMDKKNIIKKMVLLK